jgi:pyrrolidone-carboxylate peptidase
MVETTTFEHQLCLHLTGFGEFGGRKDNPTTDLVNSIEEVLAANPVPGLHLASKRVIKVAIQDCDEALQDIYTQIAQQREVAPNFARRYMVLNLGVNGGARKIALEMQGVNN